MTPMTSCLQACAEAAESVMSSSGSCKGEEKEAEGWTLAQPKVQHVAYACCRPNTLGAAEVPFLFCSGICELLCQ